MPKAPPIGMTLLIMNDVWRIRNAGLYLRPGRAAWYGHTYAITLKIVIRTRMPSATADMAWIAAQASS